MPGSYTLESNDPKGVFVLAGLGKGAPSIVKDAGDNAKSVSNTGKKC